MGFTETLFEYGWKICLLSLIGCILVGIIKTPISKIVTKRLDAISAGIEKRKKADAIYDSLVYLGNYIIAFVIAIIYTSIFIEEKDIAEIFKLSIQVWVLQNTIYGIWKKLGLKGLLELLLKGLKDWLVKFFDRNNDGIVEVHEIVGTANEMTKDGKVDTAKLFGRAAETLPSAIQSTATAIEQAAPEETNMKSTEEASNEIKSKVIDLTSIVKDSKLKF